MKTRTLSVGQFLGIKLSPRSPTAWKPPAGEAGIELVNKPGVRELSVVCIHGCLKGTFETHGYVRNLFGSVHPECPVRWVHKVWWPAAEAGVAARGVTATPGAAAQAALERVRARGQEVEAFLATHGCVECVSGLSEVSRLDGSAAVAFALIHEPGCPALEV